MLKWWFTRPGRLNEPEGPRVECCERPVLADRVAALQDHMVGVIVNDHGIVKAETRILWSTRGVERRMASPGCECGVVVDSNSPDQFARGHSSRILVTGSAVARGMHHAERSVIESNTTALRLEIAGRLEGRGSMRAPQSRAILCVTSHNRPHDPGLCLSS
jgi:hypothetical protein